MTSVLVFGSNGMLGSAVTKYLSETDLQVVEVNRSGLSICSENKAYSFDATLGDLTNLFTSIEKPDYVINCVGLIKQKIDVAVSGDLKRAITINSQFPIELAETCEQFGSKLIQIATDCVFSGSRGDYSEEDQRDPIDVYGYSKALGETRNKNLMTIRCSIIGHELNSSSSLLSWVLSQPQKSVINGFANHYWNGLTTLHFAKVCEAIIKNESFTAMTLHLTPRDTVSKFELVKTIAKEFGRDDLSVIEHHTVEHIDRRLSTVNAQVSDEIWVDAGYKSPPTVGQMIHEYANWTYNA